MTTQESTETPANNIRYLKGIGPKRALALAKLGVHSVRDLLYFFPRRHEDRSRFSQIADLVPGQPATIRGEVLKVQFKPIRRMPILEVLVGDPTGTVTAVWFNQAYLKNQFEAGAQVIFYGKLEFYKNRLQITSPEFEFWEAEEPSTHTGRITPIYPLTEGLFQRSLRHTLKEALDTQLEKTVHEYLPESFRKLHGLLGLTEAVREMHFPGSFEALEKARNRIVFDEFLLFEITLLRKIERMKSKYTARAFQDGRTALGEFIRKLPFTPTGDQEKAMKELLQDLETSVPMNRLLEGDVGSGKTVVAAFALAWAAKNQYQGALLVPTEILAEQHEQTLKKILSPFQIPIGLLTSSTPGPRREKMLAELKQGKLPVVVGTHALLQEDIQFRSLALLVVDEQHKFGVYQRNALLHKEPRPHQLVMTATPIPRTLALTLYGDLEVSTLRELPKGRQPIKTYWITRKKQDLVLKHLLEKTQKGEQAYIIFPLIEETEKSDLFAAKEEYEKLRTGIFSTVKMGLVHGRLEPSQRESFMKSFREGSLQILVATSVIEVGVDNPNATLMVIENAERFGLSQLHQMRGRIGRGHKPSECFLFGEPKTPEGQRRLRILTKTQDGFQIAEEDLRLRGPGDFWGSRQSGEPLFRVADPLADERLLEEARKCASDLVKNRRLETQEWEAVKLFLDQHPLRY